MPKEITFGARISGLDVHADIPSGHPGAKTLVKPSKAPGKTSISVPGRPTGRPNGTLQTELKNFEGDYLRHFLADSLRKTKPKH